MAKSVADNVRDVCARIEGAAVSVGRDPAAVTILAATKNRSADEIEEAVSAGIRVVGENRVQEMVSKRKAVAGKVEWDFIGHLQRNKVRSIVGLVRIIHSVDSERLAREIDRRATEADVIQPVLLQVNAAREEGKFGIEPEQVDSVLEALMDCRNISIGGLSTVAPLVEEAEEVRPVFRKLKDLGLRLEREMEYFECRDLSMGMTGDFEVAIKEGSTIVRIGTAIFDLD